MGTKDDSALDLSAAAAAVREQLGERMSMYCEYLGLDHRLTAELGTLAHFWVRFRLKPVMLSEGRRASVNHLHANDPGVWVIRDASGRESGLHVQTHETLLELYVECRKYPELEERLRSAAMEIAHVMGPSGKEWT